MTIKDICIKYNLSQTALSKHFNIPLRTVQNWYLGSRKPPEYIIDMIIKILEYEKQNN